MADLYTCSCGNQTWHILDNVVRCASCNSEFRTVHTPVLEFNHTVAQEVEEELEEA